MTHPSDPFASPHVGPTPFASTPTAPKTSRVCPKCGWHHEVETHACAACGLIFARYAEVERRRHAIAAANTAPAPAVAADPGPPERQRSVTSGLELDRGYVMSTATASLLAPVVDDTPRSVRIGAVIGDAAAGAIAASVALIAIQLTPFAILAGVFFASSSLANGVAWLTAKLGPPGLMALSVLTSLVMVRIACGLLAAAVVAMDDAMETSEVRSTFFVLGEGWARGFRAMGVLFVGALMAAALGAPVAYALFSKVKGPPLVALGVVVAAVALVCVVRLCLAFPLAVVGQRDVLESFGESWRLTSGHFVAIGAVLCLTSLMAAAVSKLLWFSMVAPFIGIFVVFVGNALLTGFCVGVTTGMFRQLSPPPTRLS